MTGTTSQESSMTRCCSLLAALLAAFSFSSLLAAEWPQWRGPNRDGKSSETGLLDAWDSDGPPLLWKTQGLGAGYSSVAVAQGKIYTMGTIKGQESIIAVDMTGKRLWATPLGSGNEPNCTPTYDSGAVFGLTKRGDFACLDAKTGKVRWSKNFSKDFGGRMMSGWGYSESPLIDGNTVVCTPGAQNAAIVALDKKSGKTIWRASTPSLGRAGKDGAGYSSIVVAEVGGIRQYIQLMGRGVIGVNAKDGSFLWNYNRVANGTANIPTPVVKDDYVFCSTGYGTGAALLKLTPKGGGIEAQEVYFLNGNKLQNHHGGMILIGDHIYCGRGHNNGFPTCIEMLTGKEAWSQGRGPGSGSAAVTYADGHLYFRYESGLMALIEATPDEYREKDTFKIPVRESHSWSHPVISDGKLYLRAQDTLLCYNVEKK
jgi:outer membrane protein assembly factor BamB